MFATRAFLFLALRAVSFASRLNIRVSKTLAQSTMACEWIGPAGSGVQLRFPLEGEQCSDFNCNREKFQHFEKRFVDAFTSKPLDSRCGCFVNREENFLFSFRGSRLHCTSDTCWDVYVKHANLGAKNGDKIDILDNYASGCQACKDSDCDQIFLKPIGFTESQKVVIFNAAEDGDQDARQVKQVIEEYGLEPGEAVVEYLDDQVRQLADQEDAVEELEIRIEDTNQPFEDTIEEREIKDERAHEQGKVVDVIDPAEDDSPKNPPVNGTDLPVQLVVGNDPMEGGSSRNTNASLGDKSHVARTATECSHFMPVGAIPQDGQIGDKCMLLSKTRINLVFHSWTMTSSTCDKVRALEEVRRHPHGWSTDKFDDVQLKCFLPHGLHGEMPDEHGVGICGVPKSKPCGSLHCPCRPGSRCIRRNEIKAMTPPPFYYIVSYYECVEDGQWAKGTQLYITDSDLAPKYRKHVATMGGWDRSLQGWIVKWPQVEESVNVVYPTKDILRFAKFV